MNKSRKPLIIGIVAALVVLAALLALVLIQCTGSEPAATAAPTTEAPAPEGYEIYWNLDRAEFDGKSEAGMSSRVPEKDGYFHIRFFKDGQIVTLRAENRRVVNSIDVLDLMGLVFDENGIIVDIVKVEDMPCQYLARQFYVKSAGGNLIKANSSPTMSGLEVILECTDTTGIWDMTGLSGEVGCPATPIALDRIIAIADPEGNPTHVFIYERTNFMRTHEGACEHCGKTVTWNEWTKENYLPTQDGHYQLMNDIQLIGQNNIAEDAKICLDLNGKTVTGKEGTRMYSVHNPGAELAMMDTSAEKTGTLVARGESSSQGMCVFVRYGVFTLYDGILNAKDVEAKTSGVTVYTAKNTFMYMYGGQIIGGKALPTINKDTGKYGSGLGGSMYVAGKLVIHDGIITGGHATSAITAYNTDGTPKTYQRGLGGNLFVAGTGVVEMNGGTIQNGRSDNSGGNIYLDGTAEFTLNGGSITGGKTLGKNRSGGNIIGYSKVTLTVNGGSITNGTARYRGGNVYLTGRMTVNGGNIYGGKLLDYKTGKALADQASRNVFFSNNRLSMYGGSIDGGVQVLDSSAASLETCLVLSGYATINSKTAPNLTLSTGGSGVRVSVGQLYDRAKIGVTASGIFTDKTSEKNLDNFHSDIEGAEVLYVDGCLGLGRFGCLCGSNSENAADHLGDCKAAGIRTLFWGPITNTTKLPNTSGNYYLVADVNAASQTSLVADADVKLDLNGYTITGPENFRTISVHNTGAKLTVCDSSEGKTGVIRSHGLGSSQGNVVWTRYGSFDFYGGTLDGSAYTYTDGWSEGKDGIFGTTDDTNSSRDGGALCMGSGSTTMRMFAGTVIGNNAAAVTQTKTVDGKEVSFKTTSPGGASLYVPAGCTFEMYGGTIRDGISEDYGGNVLLAGTMIIDGGQILDGICTYNGGNINTKSGSHLELHSGSIEGGWGKNVTGNLHCSGTFTMTGGEITGGKVGKTPSATSAHADIQFVNGDMDYTGGKLGNIQLTNSNTSGTEGGCVVTLSGELDIAAIKLSTYDSKPEDEKNPTMPILVIGGTVQSANAIPVTPSDTTADFAIGKDYALCSADAAPFTLSGSTVTAAADTTTNSLFFGRIDCLCGKETHTKGCMDLWNGEARRWTPWASTTTLPNETAGNYYLTCDVTLSTTQTLKKNAVVALDLNGYTVTGPNNTRMYATQNEGTSLTITDRSTAQTGKLLARGTNFVGIKSTCIWIRYGTFNLLGGTLDGSQTIYQGNWDDGMVERHGGVICAEGNRTVNIYGGTVIGATTKATTINGNAVNAPNGGSIYIPSGATLNMYGGTVKGGNTGRYGGNLYLIGTANLYGGTIEGGIAENNGGNIYVEGGTLNLRGATVIGGNSSKYGGNIYLASGTLNMASGTLKDGTCTLNGGNLCTGSDAVVTLSGGTVSGGWGKNVTGNLHVNGNLTMSGGTVTGGKTGAGGTGSAHADLQLVNATFCYTGGTVGYLQATNSGTDGTKGGCDVSLSGELAIGQLYLSSWDGNTEDAKIPADPTVNITGKLSGNTTLKLRQYGVFGYGKDYTVTGSDAACFTASALAPFATCATVQESNTLAVYGTACLCGKTTHTKGCQDLWKGESRVWKPWTSAGTLPITTGNYYLTGPVDLKDVGVQKLAANANVVLDLNGFTVTGKNNDRMYATHNTDSNLTITDKSEAQTGRMVGKCDDYAGLSCCIWVRYGEFNLLGGTLDGSQAVMHNGWENNKLAEKNGGVLSIASNRAANIYGGTIIGATTVAATVDGHDLYAPNGGAVYVPSGATLNMYAGTIEGGNSARYGGNLYINGGTANLFGGTISGGSAENGGNIYCTGTLNIHKGATIEGGNASKYGGNIRLTGTINMDGGKITSGTCDLNGGNLYTNGGSTLNLSDGEITGGWGKNVTGNIHLCGSMTMSGGSVTGGKTGKTGATTSAHADVQLVNGALTVTGGQIGSVQATNYNCDGTEGGCTLELGGGNISQIKLSALDDDADDSKTPDMPIIAVSAAIPAPVKLTTARIGQFAEGKGYTLTAADATQFAADAVAPFKGSAVEKVDNTLVIYGMDCLCGKTTHTKGCQDLWKGESKVWKPWTSDNTLPTTTGNYYLTAPVDLAEKGVQKLAANANVVLDLNGFTVTGKNNDRMYATHNTGSNLTITDKSEAQSGKMVGTGTDFAGKSCCIWVRYGEFNLLGGTLDGSQAIIHNGWENNKLSEKNGGVLCLEPNRTANIYGGTIIGAKAIATNISDNELYAPMGASIYIPSGATMNMYGGTVKNGITEKNGGNIYIKGGTLNLYNGTIEGGDAKDCGGNLFVNGGTVNMTGGFIKNGKRAGSTANTSANCAFINGGKLNISGGEIHGRITTGSVVLSGDTKTGSVNISGSAKIYTPTAANPVSSNNVTISLTTTVGKLNDDAMLGFQVSASVSKPLTSDKNNPRLLATFTDEESIQKALDEGRIGISVYIASDTHKRTYAFVTKDNKLYAYQSSATPK